jgi:dolichol-phosphate mannosyltransferase
LHGAGLILGLFSFYVACSLGAFVNILVASFAVANGAPWYVGGGAGVVVSSVWNYAATAILTWRRRRQIISGIQTVREAIRAPDITSDTM